MEADALANDRLGAEAAKLIEDAHTSETAPSTAANWTWFLATMEKGGYDAVVLTQAELQHLATVKGVGTEPATFLLRPMSLTT